MSEKKKSKFGWYLIGFFIIAGFVQNIYLATEIYIKILIGWWVAATTIRLIYVIPGRVFGFLDHRTVHKFHWLWIPWRPFYLAYLPLKIWYYEKKLGQGGSAGWANPLLLMSLLYKPGHVFLGKLRMWGLPFYQYVGIKSGEGHIFMSAGPASGKTSMLISMIAMELGNLFVIDPAGQVVNALYNSLVKKGKNCFKLDPYNLAKHPGANWNALDEITRAVEMFGMDCAVRFAATISEGLIKNDSTREPYFANAARSFISGLILYVWLKDDQKHIIRVRQLLTQGLPEKAEKGEDPFHALLYEMSQCTDFDGAIARAASVMATNQGRDNKNHPRSTAIEQTKFLDFPEVSAISQSSDFSVFDLKTGNCSLFLVAPLGDLESKLSGWFRMLTVLSMYAFENVPGGLEHPCGFYLDELPSLGKIDVIEKSAAKMRKYGIRLIAICQDIKQLAIYPDWEALIGSAEICIWMSTNHFFQMEYISKKLGMCKKKEKIEGGWGSDVPARYQVVDRQLMTPDQVAKFLDKDKNNLIIERAGKNPLKLKQAPYWKMLPIWDYEPDEFYGEKALRAWFRGFLNRREQKRIESNEVKMLEGGNHE